MSRISKAILVQSKTTHFVKCSLILLPLYSTRYEIGIMKENVVSKNENRLGWM